MVLIAALINWLGRRAIKPIIEMTATTGKLAAGDLAVDIPGGNRSDEIGDMARALEQIRTVGVNASGAGRRPGGRARDRHQPCQSREPDDRAARSLGAVRHRGYGGCLRQSWRPTNHRGPSPLERFLAKRVHFATRTSRQTDKLERFAVDLSLAFLTINHTTRLC